MRMNTQVSPIVSPEDQLATLSTIMEQAIDAAQRYYALTGKPLGITGEVGEFLAAKILGLELMPPRTEGFDAIDANSNDRFEIKSRCLDLTKHLAGQRLSRINLEYEWDYLLMLLMDQSFKPLEIYRAGRAEVEAAIRAPGSKARNERHALPISKIKSIGDASLARRYLDCYVEY
jgi:hypothetical protein